jgi:hypothetical protein
MDFSLLMVTPTPPFLMWLQEFKVRKGIGAYDVHFAEEDSVWLIPHRDRFPTAATFESFIQECKPRMLLAELYRFGGAPGDLPVPISVDAFDDYFTVSIRDRGALISELFANG